MAGANVATTMPSTTKTASAPMRRRLERTARRLLRNRVEQVHRGEQTRRAPQLAEPLVEDALDLAAEIDLRQRTIHLEPQRRVVARQRHRVGLERKILGRHPEFRGVLRLRDEAHELDLV